MTSQLTIRRAVPQDADALSALGQKTFADNFAYLYDAADLAAYLAEEHSVAYYEELLSDAGKGVWVADAPNGEGLAAYAVAGPCGLPTGREAQEPKAGEVKRLYVDTPYQGAALGAQLMEAMLDWLVGRDHSPLYVGVWSENEGAQRFYARYGFGKVGEYFFPVGKHRDLEFIFRQTEISD